MSRFESKEVEVEAGIERLRDFLTDARNLHELLPQERIEDWKADEESCSFRISGLSSLDLHRVESESEDEISYHSGERSPFPIRMSAHLETNGSGTKCRMICEAELNPFLEQIAKGPLERLFDHMAERISEQDL